MTDTLTGSTPCLELRIDQRSMDEESFTLLAERMNALGYGEENDLETGTHHYIAWFHDDQQAQQHPDLFAAAVMAGANTEDVSIKTLGDNWETAWQKDWSAQAIGQSLCVRPSFCSALESHPVDIVLEPGMAFGTGTHPTTRLCLEAIEDYCLHHAPASMLDMGSGSGLLAIAAIKLGAVEALAIDNDADSVAACINNAAHNHVQLRAVLADTPPTERFELVVANILAGPLLTMVTPLAACVDDTLILSGLLVDQQEAICQAYEAEGLQLQSRAEQRAHGDDWLALVFRRS